MRLLLGLMVAFLGLLVAVPGALGVRKYRDFRTYTDAELDAIYRQWDENEGTVARVFPSLDRAWGVREVLC